MNINIILFKDSNCDLCKLIQQELINNPPKADISIVHVKHDNVKQIAYDNKVTIFPTIIIYYNNIEIKRYEGFIDSKTIDKYIEDYETKSMV